MEQNAKKTVDRMNNFERENFKGWTYEMDEHGIKFKRTLRGVNEEHIF